MEGPQITVGIPSGREIEFSFPESFTTPDGTKVSGAQKAAYQKEKIYWSGEEYDELIFYPRSDAGIFFELKDVTIGVSFHWERKEVQRFQGALKIIVEGETLTAINVISIEDYLTGVISSEMSAAASLELLKVHAIISRSWLINRLRVENEKWKAIIQPDSAVNSPYSTLHFQLIKWYDHEVHTHFNVCADNYCQRYQGITRASTPQAIEAVSAIRGKVLMYEGKICDARLSKCCDGAMEELRNCWEGVRRPYLTGKRDYVLESHASDPEKQTTDPAIQLPDLTQEEETDRRIRTSPDAFCNTQDRKILSQVLSNYDQETTNFYRWKISYSQQELAESVHQRSGIDLGEIIDLIPVERGASGRLIRLKIVGTLWILTIGKELEIQRTLSPSHLYSSAFLMDKEKGEEGNVPTYFTLAGAGWGHGVELRQIGAAVMGERGYYYKDILTHHYPGSRLEKQYE